MGHGGDKRLGMRVIQAIALAACVGLVFGARQLAPRTSPIVDVITPVGLFLMAGTLAAAVFDGFRIPYLSAYLIVGIVSGPFVLHLVSHADVETLRPVNGLALALIAFGGGAELRIADLRRSARSLSFATFTQWLGLLAGAALSSPYFLVSFHSRATPTGAARSESP